MKRRLASLKPTLTAYIINLMALTVFWGGLLRRGYNADTVSHMADPSGSIPVRLELGRYIIALLESLQLRSGILLTDHIPLTILTSLMISAMTLTMIQSMFEKAFKLPSGTLLHRVGFRVCLSFVFLNVLFSETLMFSEFCLYFSLAYLFAGFGAWLYIKGSIPSRITAVIMFLAGVFTYQNSAVFAALILLFWYGFKHDMKWSLKAAADESTAVSVPMAAGGINLISVKVLERLNPDYSFFRPIEVGSFSDKLILAWQDLYSLNRDSSNLLPGFFIPGIISLIMGFLVIYLLIKKSNTSGILFFALMCAVSLILFYIMPVMNSPFTNPPRMAFLFYLIQGLLGATVFYLLSDSKTPGIPYVRIRNAVSVIFIGYLWINLIFSQFIVTGRFISNTLDNVYASLALQKIERYEKETGDTVRNLCVFNDTDSTFHYRESSIHTHQINERIIGQTTCSYIEAILGRHFEPLYADSIPDEIRSEYFEGRNWDEFDAEEQIIIAGDTAYWCIY